MPRTHARLGLLAAVALAAAVLVPSGPAVAAPALPASVDLSAFSVPVGDQGANSSCTGWAFGYTLLGWLSRRTGYVGQPFAPMYLYSQTNGGVDNSASSIDTLNLMRTQGTDTWADYTQGPDDWLTQPTAAEKANARRWRISGYTTLFQGTAGTRGAASIKAALAAGRPAAFTLWERPGFDTLRGTAVDHDTTGTYHSDHALVAVGYDSSGLLVQNSFGTGWGNKGYGRIGWDVVEHDVTEAYTIAGFLLDPSARNTGPVVSPPSQKVQVGGRLTAAGTVPYTVSFGAVDAARVTDTRLYRQVDGGSWVRMHLPSATARSTVVRLAPGHRYRFAAAARGSLSGWSPRRYAASFRVGSRSERNAAVKYKKHWTTSTPSSAVGRRLRVSTAAGASVTLRYTGTSVAWVASRSRTRSSAKVYVDGHYRGTVNLHSSSTHVRDVVGRYTTRAGHHTLRIVVTSSGGRRSIDVDGFVVTS